MINLRILFGAFVLRTIIKNFPKYYRFLRAYDFAISKAGIFKMEIFPLFLTFNLSDATEFFHFTASQGKYTTYLFISANLRLSNIQKFFCRCEIYLNSRRNLSKKSRIIRNSVFFRFFFLFFFSKLLYECHLLGSMRK